MKKIHLLSLLSFIFFSNAFSEKTPTSYKADPIIFNRLEADTLDNLINRIGKDSVLHLLDKRIKNATEIVKGNIARIRNEITAPELICLNKHFKLGIDSFLVFAQEVEYKELAFVLYDEKIFPKDYKDIENFINQQKKNKELLDLMYKNIHHLGGKTGIIFYCNIISDIITENTMDSIYKIALFYPENMRNDYYFTLAQYDKSCGNDKIKSAYYKKQLYDTLYTSSNLITALTDTNEINNLTYLKYQLAPKYEFFAYSLYAHDFDIKNNQKEVIYFLTSQNKYGGFKPLNIVDEQQMQHGAESTVYGLWALLELRTQIDKLYP